MPKIVDLPDGTEAEFPDEMDDAAISAVLRKQFGPSQQAAPAPVDPMGAPALPMGKGAMANAMVGRDPADYTNAGAMLPTAGAVLGGIAGAPAGPAGIIGGSALGGAGGEAYRQLLQRGTNPEAAPQTPVDAAGAIAREGLIDGGLAVVPGLGSVMKPGVGGKILRFAGPGAVVAGAEVATGGDPGTALKHGAFASLATKIPAIGALVGGKGKLGMKIADWLGQMATREPEAAAKVAQALEAKAGATEAKVATEAAETITPKLSDKVKVGGRLVTKAKATELERLGWPAGKVKLMSPDEIKEVLGRGETWPPGAPGASAALGPKASGRTAYGYSSKSPNERFAVDNTPHAKVGTTDAELNRLLGESIESIAGNTPKSLVSAHSLGAEISAAFPGTSPTKAMELAFDDSRFAARLENVYRGTSREINASNSFLDEGLRGQPLPKKVRAWRHGKYNEETGESRNWRDDKSEAGLSVMGIEGQADFVPPIFERTGGGYVTKPRVKVDGYLLSKRGSDGEPLLAAPSSGGGYSGPKSIKKVDPIQSKVSAFENEVAELSKSGSSRVRIANVLSQKYNLPLSETNVIVADMLRGSR